MGMESLRGGIKMKIVVFDDEVYFCLYRFVLWWISLLMR